tara:strand:- start:414 stop:575 length:162 start_codon:yes stop_codon:yes gene_type:complete
MEKIKKVLTLIYYYIEAKLIILAFHIIKNLYAYYLRLRREYYRYNYRYKNKRK